MESSSGLRSTKLRFEEHAVNKEMDTRVILERRSHNPNFGPVESPSARIVANCHYMLYNRRTESRSSYVREREIEQLLVRELRESRKKGLPAVSGLPSLVSDHGLAETSIIGDIFAQGP